MGGLFNSTVWDIIIGLAFVYLLLAILCTAANELLESILKSRAKYLKEGISRLLDGQSSPATSPPATSPPNSASATASNALLAQFYQHPLITGMMRGNKHPAYLSAETFASTLLDLISPSGRVATSFADLETDVNALPEGDVKKTLLALLRRSSGDLDQAHRAIQKWFDDAMDRVSGWYKRRTQLFTIIISAVLIIIANADSIQIAKRLWTDPVLRSMVVAEAQNRSKKPPPVVEYSDKDNPTEPTVTEGNSLSQQEQQLLTQLIGWGDVSKDTKGDWLVRALGWLLTILAVSLGAPFWFDLLNKFVNIRAAGKSPDESAKKPDKK